MFRPAASRSTPAPTIRRLVLGGAFLIGLAFALVPRTSVVLAQESKAAPAAASKIPAAGKASTAADGAGGTAKVDQKAADSAGKTPVAADNASDDEEAAPATGKSGSGKHSVVIGKHGRIQIDGGPDHEFDSFNDLVRDEPGMAFMIVAIVAVVFLSPVLLIGLILWYRFRKSRMLSETMIKLAEKGAVSAADAIDALGGGKSTAAFASVGAGQVYEQAKQIRRRAAWSDLRKGVFTGGVGFALTLYSALEDQTPNGLGLVLLFVGIGFVVLWWFEERQLAPMNGTAAAPVAQPDASRPPA
jgi:hypothetical protein